MNRIFWTHNGKSKRYEYLTQTRDDETSADSKRKTENIVCYERSEIEDSVYSKLGSAEDFSVQKRQEETRGWKYKGTHRNRTNSIGKK